MNTIHLSAQSNTIERFLVTSSACVYPRHCSIPTKEEEVFKVSPNPQTLVTVGQKEWKST